MFKILGITLIGIAVLWGVYFRKEVPPPVKPSEDDWWGPSSSQSAHKDTAIKPFKINVSQDVLDDLNARLDRTRVAPPLEGVHFEYGFNTDTLKKVISYWRKNYNWKKREAFLNQFPQYKTRIQGLDIHFLHVKPSKKLASVQKRVPLLLLHGWPGSVREFYSLIPLLVEQPPDGADFVFEVVAPSLPGYGFSSGAARPGLGPAQMAVIFKQLMSRLGYENFYIQGGDWGSQIASHLALFYPEAVTGLHLNLCYINTPKSMVKILLGSFFPRVIVDAENEHKMYPLGEKFGDKLLETGYLHIQATKPDTVGVGLTDSPAGLAAYILEKFSTGTNFYYRSKKDGGLTEKYTYDDLLDNVMLYWITGSITSSVRIYAENFSKGHRALNLDTAQVTVPTWCSKFRTEVGWAPDWLLKERYPHLIRSTNYNFGGHFAALELPKVLAEDIWSAVVEGEENMADSKP